MAVHHGKNGKVKLGSNLIAELKSWTINDSVDTADTTTMGDTAKTHLSGIPGWTLSFEVLHDPADTNGQNVLVTGASLSFGVYSDGDATGKKYFTGTATVTGRTRSGTLNEAVAGSFNCLGNGTLSEATVA